MASQPPQIIALDSLAPQSDTAKPPLQTATSSFSAKEDNSFLDVKSDPSQTRSTGSRKIWLKPSRAQWEEIGFAIAPLLIHAAAIALAVVQLFQTTIPMLDAQQVGGTGRIQYFVTSSCHVAPGTIERICTPRSINANFVPSVVAIAPAVPGFAVQQLPYYSSQTPTIYLTSLVAIFLSFCFFFPVWLLAYFPTTTIISMRVTKLIRRFAWHFYFITGLLAFTSMMLSLTVGISWKLILKFSGGFFIQYISKAFFSGTAVAAGATFWKVDPTQSGFRFTWAQTTFAGLVALGSKAALHNLMDERVERYGQDDEYYSNVRY